MTLQRPRLNTDRRPPETQGTLRPFVKSVASLSQTLFTPGCKLLPRDPL